MINDLSVIIPVYLVTVGLQLLAWPWLFHFNKRLVDYGWAMGRIGSSLVVATIIFVLGNLRLPINSSLGLTGTLITLMIVTWKLRRREIKESFFVLKKIWQVIFWEETLFLVGFVAYAFVRGFQPDILGLEKFMDYGFIKRYLSTSTLPAMDMWWAGGTINYYSFGHFWTSILIRTWGVPPGVGYNLMLAFILASGLSLSFSVIVNLLTATKVRGDQIIGGLFGSIALVIGGNSHTVWSYLSKGTLQGYWYADATRFIYNTIHEFPSYSFVVSDLHGHVLGLPVVLAFVLLFIGWTRGSKSEIGLGWLLGVMAMTNTWDSLIFGLLLVIYSLLQFISDKKSLGGLLKSGFIIGLVAAITAFFWIIGFESISDGVAAVTKRTPFWQLLVLWTVQVGVTVVAMAYSLLSKKTNILIIALGLTAISLILIPEFIYVKDIYPDHPRANTMFKLTYQAFVIMSLLFGWVFSKTIEVKRTTLRFVGSILVCGVFLSLMIFPVIAFPSYFNSFAKYRGIDGTRFLSERFNNDFEVIKYLEKNGGGKNMVEAPGDSYTETNFIPAFSGTPTVLGWRVHEWLWRGGYDQVGARDEEIRRFYEEGGNDEVATFLDKYRIGWIVVSGREREKYRGMEEEKILKLGERIDFGSTYLVKVVN